MRTKWQILQERLLKAQKAAQDLEVEINGLGIMPFNGKCPGCGEFLKTERDFADHFLVPDERYLNLGECPRKFE